MNGTRAFRRTLALALALLALGAGGAQALTLQPVGNFDQPTYVTSDPGDASRLFVWIRRDDLAAGRFDAVQAFVR